MSMSLEFYLEYEYFPYFSKEQILEEVKKWKNSEDARKYVMENYDRCKKERDDFFKNLKQ